MPKPIQFNFAVPDDYHRDFYLEIDGAAHKIEVRGNWLMVMVVGEPTPKQSSLIMDWMQESIEQVRSEFGQ